MEMAQAIIYFVILLFSVVIHECSHALAAYRNGDDTAYLMERLTLNPIPHSLTRWEAFYFLSCFFYFILR